MPDSEATHNPDSRPPAVDKKPDGAKLNPELISREHRRGSRPGDVVVRVKRPKGFQKVGPGHFLATPEANIPEGRLDRIFLAIKRIFIGLPLANVEESQERLGVGKALAVFGSDAISSSAYATEAALLILMTAGSAALHISLYTSIAVAVVFAIVVFSYRQIVYAYPQGGGAYNVSKTNLGKMPSLIAAAALVIDYVLTVAVSIVAGVQAITSALIVSGHGHWIQILNDKLPGVAEPAVVLCLVFIGLMTLINLRGVRESGTVFSIPTYLFIIGMIAVLTIGIFKSINGTLEPASPPPIIPVLAPVTLWLILHAFSSGAVAMTGTEAISNGVPSFKPPESRKAARTMTLMAICLAAFFLGISFLANHMHLVPGTETIISQTALAVFGPNIVYYVFQIATMGILVVAANTAFSGFPRLASVLAADGFMPRQFLFKGDRLAFSTGILALGIAASLLVVLFQGNIGSLINLYAIGVFLAFSLSNSGMVIHWFRVKTKGWRMNMVINGTAAVMTAVILFIAIVTKFAEGGWIVIVMAPVIVLILLATRDHYDRTAAQLRITEREVLPAKLEQLAILPIDDVNRASLRAMAFVRTISTESLVLHVSTNPERSERLKQKMKKFAPDFKLVIVESPTSSFVQPMITYINAIHSQSPETLVTIVFPEFITARWWEQFLHNRTARRLYRVFEKHPNVAVVLVPYQLVK
ncbi:APC family permease [Dehalogenimonas etheniformans]|uniref:APC family permease n=1 Tax=Dehalogenimonas etheniformans TaxID=1536648 RepID=A0A2P5P7S8_9CHLR|nr:APC family permease [Dehalogenimonas etheniformans]PPD58351.1 APC family permease [Dehalogenimonas etheniformans]QNT76923.1 APC family permease [Dehalogenimonas etheniformans]